VIYRLGCRFRIGRANILRQGEHVSMPACEPMVLEGLEAAEILARRADHADSGHAHAQGAGHIGHRVRGHRERGTSDDWRAYRNRRSGRAVAEMPAEADVSVPFRHLGMQDAFANEGNADNLRQLDGMYGGVVTRETMACWRLHELASPNAGWHSRSKQPAMSMPPWNGPFRVPEHSRARRLMADHSRGNRDD
jgi:hypothetical protein